MSRRRGTNNASYRATTEEVIRLDTVDDFGREWVFRLDASCPEPHRLILEEYRDHRIRRTRSDRRSLNDARDEDDSRLLEVFQRRYGSDPAFTSAVNDSLVTSQFLPFGTGPTRFSAHSLAIITGYTRLAGFMLREIPDGSFMAYRSGVVHPITAAVFALYWDAQNANIRSLINPYLYRLIVHTTDADIQRVPGLIKEQNARSMSQVYVYKLFFCDLMMLYANNKVDKAIIMWSLRRPCMPTVPMWWTNTNGQPLSLFGMSALTVWLHLPTTDQEIDLAFLRHPDVVAYLVHLYDLHSPSTEEAGLEPTKMTSTDSVAANLLCDRMRRQFWFKSQVRRIVSKARRVNLDQHAQSDRPTSLLPVRPMSICEMLTYRVPAEFADPDRTEPVIEYPPLAHLVLPSTDHTSTQSNAFVVADQIVQTHAAPVIGDFFPYNDAGEQIPSRALGGRREGTRKRREGASKRREGVVMSRTRTKVDK